MYEGGTDVKENLDQIQKVWIKFMIPFIQNIMVIDGFLLVEIMPHRMTINRDMHCTILKKAQMGNPKLYS